jgi:hypothetical protein
LKIWTVVGVLLISIFAVGCALQAMKNAVTTIRSSDIAYGAVVDIKPGDSKQTEKNCASNNNSARWASFCANRSAYNQVKIAYFHSTRLVSTVIAIPADWKVEKGSIIQTAPRTSSIATRLAATSQHDGCRWTGFPLDNLNSGTGIAEGFVAGLLIIPTIAITVDDSIMEGGVECDGWSYKTLLNKDTN